MHRVRIGMTGLAVVFLMVLLAAALLGMLRRESAQRGAQVADGQGAGLNGAAAETPKEPLAELGVAPGTGPAATPPATRRPAAAPSGK